MPSNSRDLPNNPKLSSNVTGIQSIYQSLDNLLNTNKGDRLFNPDFGSDLENLLFEPLDELTAFTIYNNIIKLISKEEPRIVLHYGGSSVVANFYNNSFDVTLKFKLLNDSSDEYNNSFSTSLLRS